MCAHLLIDWLRNEWNFYSSSIICPGNYISKLLFSSTSFLIILYFIILINFIIIQLFYLIFKVHFSYLHVLFVLYINIGCIYISAKVRTDNILIHRYSINLLLYHHYFTFYYITITFKTSILSLYIKM